MFKKINFQKLNGWQRLFLLLAIFVYVPVSIGLIANKVYIEPLDGKDLVKILPDDVLISLSNGEMKLAKSTDGIGTPGFCTEEGSVRNGESVFCYTHTFASSWDSSWDYLWTIKTSVGKEKSDALSTSFMKSLDTYILRDSIVQRVIRFFYCVFGALVIYFFGWMLGWVVKGFRR